MLPDPAHPAIQTKIYSLVDPRTGLVRYIGRTKRKLRYRFNQHIRDAKKYSEQENGYGYYSTRWIWSLLRIGLEPVMKEIETCNSDGCAEETYHIRLARADGLKLTNANDGGAGPGINPILATRKKMSASLKGRKAPNKIFSDAQEKEICREYQSGGITKQIAANRGVRFQLISNILRRHGIEFRPCALTPEQMAKMANSKRGKKRNLTPEQRDVIGSWNRGKKKSSETLQRMIAAQNRPEILAIKSASGKRRWARHRAERNRELLFDPDYTP